MLKIPWTWWVKFSASHIMPDAPWNSSCNHTTMLDIFGITCIFPVWTMSPATKVYPMSTPAVEKQSESKITKMFIISKWTSFYMFLLPGKTLGTQVSCTNHNKCQNTWLWLMCHGVWNFSTTVHTGKCSNVTSCPFPMPMELMPLPIWTPKHRIHSHTQVLWTGP